MGHFNNSYDYELDHFGNHTDASKQDTWYDVLFEPFSVISTLVVFSLGISFIAACLIGEKLRPDPGRWTQLLVVVCVLITHLIDMLGPYTNILSQPGVCSVTVPTRSILQSLITLGLLFTIIERLTGVFKREPDTPAFSRRCGFLIIAGAVVGALALNLGLWITLGRISLHEFRDEYYCSGNGVAAFVIRNIHRVLILIMFVTTLALIVSLCRARKGKITPYPMGRVVPVIVSSLVIFTFFVLDMIVEASGFMSYQGWLIDLIIVMLIWLFGDAEVRNAYRSVCCACCPGPKPDEDKGTLLDPSHP